MARELMLDIPTIKKIKRLYNLKKNGKRLYSHEKLARMFFVERTAIRRYLKLKVRGDGVVNG